MRRAKYIRLVNRYPGMSAWELAKLCGMRGATVSAALYKLARTGAIRRLQEPSRYFNGFLTWKYYSAVA